MTLKEVVQVRSKEPRGVPEVGVSSCHLGPPASESQGFLLAMEGLGPTQTCWPDTRAGTWGLHSV